MRKILVVDDDLDLLIMLQLVLKSNGYEVTTLAEGSHVLEVLRQLRPDLLILDINIGDWDGRDICRSVKAAPDFCHIPVILFSAAVDYSDALADCNADAFIQKPLSTPLFFKKIEELIAA